MKVERLRQQLIVILILSTLFLSCRALSSVPYLGGLPEIDKVELFKLEKNGDLWTGKFTAQKALNGAAAKQVAQLWRTQSYSGNDVICHNPGYAIKFYQQEKLLVYATLCWDCDNIEFITPKEEQYVAFDGKGKQGQALLQYLEKTLAAE